MNDNIGYNVMNTCWLSYTNMWNFSVFAQICETSLYLPTEHRNWNWKVCVENVFPFLNSLSLDKRVVGREASESRLNWSRNERSELQLVGSFHWSVAETVVKMFKPGQIKQHRQKNNELKWSDEMIWWNNLYLLSRISSLFCASLFFFLNLLTWRKTWGSIIVSSVCDKQNTWKRCVARDKVLLGTRYI